MVQEVGGAAKESSYAVGDASRAAGHSGSIPGEASRLVRPPGEMAARLWERIRPERLGRRALDFLQIPSPTKQEKEFSHYFAKCLGEMGMHVEMTHEYPESPNVIGRLCFGEGETLQFDGHTDTIGKPHDLPSFKEGRLYGRGACDMKGSLSAMVEAVTVLLESGVRLKGSLMITAHGLHEAPTGGNYTLDELIKKGHTGDAVVVCECADNILPIEGNGMSIFEVTVRRDGDVIHEVKGRGTPNPIFVANRILTRLQARSEELGRDPGSAIPPSLFVGMVNAGDFYNRVPVCCKIVGTRRYSHEKSFSDIREELEEIVLSGGYPGDVRAELDVLKVADGFKIPPGGRLVRSLERAYEMVTGGPLNHGAITICGNLPWFVRDAGVPAVYHGPNQDSAHADIEWVSLEELVRVTKVYVALALDYLGVQDNPGAQDSAR